MARPKGGNPCLPLNSAKVYPDVVTPTPQSRSKSTEPTNVCFLVLSRMILIIVILFILFSAMTQVSNSLEREWFNSPRCPEFQLDSASFISLDNATGPDLTVKLNVTFIVTNRNKINISISYDAIVVTLDYGGGCERKYDPRSVNYDFCNGLTSAHFPPFSQPNGSQNTLPFQLNVADQVVGNTIAADMARGSVEFGLKLIAHFKPIIVYCGNTVEFYCKRLNFVFNSHNVTFASGKCFSNASFISYGN